VGGALGGALVVKLGGELRDGVLLGIGFWLSGGLIAGLLFGLDTALETPSVSERRAPAEGVRRSSRYALRLAATGLLLVASLELAFPLLLDTLIASGDSGLMASAAMGFVVPIIAYNALYVSLLKGGSFALSHYVVRFLLWRRNLAPGRYVPFLVQAANKGILKPVGGGFQFRHRDLRRFIAERHGATWLNRASENQDG